MVGALSVVESLLDIVIDIRIFGCNSLRFWDDLEGFSIELSWDGCGVEEMEGEVEGEVLVLFPGVFVFVKAGSNLFVPVEFVAVGSGMCADPGDTERVLDII